MLVLSGILVMVIGLMLRFNALLVVVAAGFVTGLAGGLSINDIVGAIGEAFVKNRYMSLFILILPVIGLMERHGLRERAEIFDRQDQRCYSWSYLYDLLICAPSNCSFWY